jgi:alanine racemase
MRHSQCILEVDLSKICANYKILSNIANNTEVASVVKANSYGLGADKISKALEKEGCANFFVASINEAINLRKYVNSTSNIFVLNGVFYNDVAEFAEHNLVPVLNHLQQVELWVDYTKKLAKKLPCALHLDTGMSRLGMSDSEITILVNKPEILENLRLEYIISHLSSAEEQNNPYNIEQLKRFKRYLQYFPGTKASLSNSSGILLGADYHFNLVRPGAGIYGINPNPAESNIMNNVVKLTAPIIQLQILPINSHVGYNMSFTTNRDTIAATLPIGYADGYSRIFSNRGVVFIAGHIAPIIGRISMDLITIDVTDIPAQEIFLGQMVEIINDYCTINKIASIIGTSGYEILALLHGPRFKRIYKNDTKHS